MSTNDGERILREKIDAYLEDRKKFCRGFVRFTLERGLETKAPLAEGRKVSETWRQVGRRLYGTEFYEATLAEEVAQRRATRAEGRLPDVRSHQGKDGQARQTAGGSQDQRSQDHQRPRRTRPAQSPEGSTQAGVTVTLPDPM